MYNFFLHKPQSRQHARNSWGRRVIAAACLIVSATGAARADASVAVVFDGSGSMWGRASSGTKFEAGREALKTALEAAPTDARSGLYGFGLRRRGTCGEVETAVSIAQGRAPDVAASLDRLNPQGRGPIAQALEEAGTALKAMPAPRAIVLVHDDSDNCSADPCAVARGLKADMPDLKIHAITLRDPDSTPLMGCFATLTGGTVSQSLDVNDIRDATARIIQAAFQANPVSTPAATTPANTTPAIEIARSAPAGVTQIPGGKGLAVAANLASAGPRFNRPVTWTITPGGATAARSIRPRVVSGQGAFDLEPGSYTVTATVGRHSVTKTIEITKGQQTSYIADLNAADLSFTARLGTDGATVDDAAVQLRPASESAATTQDIQFSTSDGTPLLLSAGTYLATASKGGLSETVELNVVAGAAQPVGFQLPGARVVVAFGNDQTSTRRLIEIYRAASDLRAGETPVAQTTGTRGAFHLPPGDYVLVAKADRAPIRRPISIRTGQTLDISLAVRTASIKLATRLTPNGGDLTSGVAYDITSLDGPTADVRRLFTASPAVELPAGRYRMRSTILETDQHLEREIVVEPGEDQRVTLVHDVGRIRLIYVASANQTLRAANVDWDVRLGPASGRSVWRGLGREVTAYVPPGRYSIIANGDTARARSVNVTAGADVSLTVDAPATRPE